MSDLVIAKKIMGAHSEFQNFPHGQVEIEGEQPALLDEEAMDLIINSLDRRGVDMVIDYEHQTLKDVKAPAAGWVKRLEARGKQGLWAVVEWTKKAKNYLANREYRYFSPVFNVRNKDRKIVEIKMIALTNAPRLNSLRPIIAKRDFKTRIDATILQVAKLMGNTEEDIVQYGGDPADTPKESSVGDATLEVAKLMGNTEEDIVQYGGDPADTPKESSVGDATLEVAKLMGNTEGDIQTYGSLG
jgi:hypothetical protein